MSNSNMDPFDEFEFKPLTEGLGFHKKAVSLKDGLKSSGVLEESLQGIPDSVPRGLFDETVVSAPAGKKHTFEDVLSALEKTPIQPKVKVRTNNRPADLEISGTLPREAKKAALEVEVPRPVQSPFPRPEAYREKSPAPKSGPAPQSPGAPNGGVQPGPSPSATAKAAELAAKGTRRGASDSPIRRQMVPATMSVASALLDFIIVAALAIVFLVALLTVTKVDLNVVIRNLSKDSMTQLSLVIMFISVMQMYVVISRSFFGRTIGEWTFDLQVGLEKEQLSETYPLRVALRSLLVTVTGLVLLPLISTLVGRDIAGSVSGVRLYRQQD